MQNTNYNQHIGENLNEISPSITQFQKWIPGNKICESDLPLANLPTILKKVVEVFNDPSERLLVLYSSIVGIGGTLTNVKGTYDQKTCYPNLAFMALAPAASGKGAMLYTKKLLNKIHDHFLNESKEKVREYKKLKKEERKVRGNPPPQKVVFIPANSSGSKILQHSADNGPYTPAIMIESEIDTLTQATATEFGNYSDLLRKAFHNESISLSRRKDNEYIHVEFPKLAVALSGTPGQLFKLINNREDGLLSRFLVMKFSSNNGWRNVGPCPGCINLTDYFNRLSEEYFTIWGDISKQELEVKLSESQWEKLNEYCDSKLKEITYLHGEDATGIVKRHGLMTFKICMILTVLRAYEDKQESQELTCLDGDFYIAQFLVDKSLDSALEVFELLPESYSPGLDKKDSFYENLEDTFTRAEALETGKKLNIKMRSVDRYLKEFLLKELLSQESKGNYQKSKINQSLKSNHNEQ